MSKKSTNSIRFSEWSPKHGRIVTVEATLPPHVECTGQREVKHGLSISLAYFDVTCVLRARPRGKIQCKADWLSARGGRRSTGKKRMSEAIQWAVDRMKEVHLRNLDGHAGPEPSVPRGRGLRLSEGVQLIRSRQLILGETGDKTWRQYSLVLDLALAVWDDDPEIENINNKHIRKMYDARARSPGDECDEELAPFQWPTHLAHRRPVGRVGKRTVQKNLEDLRTVLGRLQGETGSNGKRFLLTPPFQHLDIGKHLSAVRDEAGPERYPWVLSAADDAVELIRTTGFSYPEKKYDRVPAGKSFRVVTRTDVFPDIVPGLLRYMLVLQFGHPTRPKSIRGIRVQDVARDDRELVRLINSLDLLETDLRIPLEWVDVWTHGGIAHRRHFSKNETERIVPFSLDLALENDRYMEKRTTWLADRGWESEWLFPSPRDPEKPISSEDAARLLRCGEQLARRRVEEAGEDPERIVPIFKGTLWYAYRRWWKTLRNRMGWENSRSAAYVGDWSIKAGSTPDTVYARLSPEMILGVVEGKAVHEVIAAADQMAAVKQAARIRPDVL